MARRLPPGIQIRYSAAMTIARARQLRKEMSRPEAIMWTALRGLKPLGFHFRRQVPLGPYYGDFACHHPKLVIEIDGRTHTDAAYDAARDAFMRTQGYRILRIGNDDVLRDLDGVMHAVGIALGLPEAEVSTPIPPPRGEGSAA